MEHFVVFTKHCLDLLFPNNGMELIMGHITGKSFSEVLMLASTNQQYDKRLFIELPVQHMKTTSAEHGRPEHGKNIFCPCSELVVFMY